MDKKSMIKLVKTIDDMYEIYNHIGLCGVTSTLEEALSIVKELENAA